MSIIWTGDEVPTLDDMRALRQPHLSYLLTDGDGDTVRVCSCGWESLPAVYPGDVEQNCAVQVAEEDGFRRRMDRQARKRRVG